MRLCIDQHSAQQCHLQTKTQRYSLWLCSEQRLVASFPCCCNRQLSHEVGLLTEDIYLLRTDASQIISNNLLCLQSQGLRLNNVYFSRTFYKSKKRAYIYFSMFLFLLQYTIFPIVHIKQPLLWCFKTHLGVPSSDGGKGSSNAREKRQNRLL